jgi:hypothetical protein
MKTPLLSLKAFLAASFGLLLFQAEGHELSLIKGSFANTGVDSDARGCAAAVFTPRNPKFRLDLGGLTPGGTYQFNVDGVLEETLTASARGSVHADFRLTASGHKLPLDFDPRGKTLDITDGTDVVLSMVFSGEGEPDAIRVDERTSLERAETEERGRVELRYLEQRNKDRFIVHFHNLDHGTYELFVDGEMQAEVVMTHGRSTMRTFEVLKNSHAKKPGNGHGNPGNGKKLELDFDPRGLVVDVVRDGEIIFSGVMLAQIPGLNGVNVGETTATLTTTGVDADATGTAVVTLDQLGVETLTVDVNALPAGDYDVVIGGVVRGTVTVTGVEPDSTGEVVFSTDPEAGELLLDFDPLGQTVEIRQGTTVFLTGTINAALDEGPAPTTTITELPLLNQGVAVDASSHVTFEADATTLLSMTVDLEGAVAGAYDVKLDGVAKGVLTVVDVDGVLSGELVFGAGGLPLDFDPFGQTLTIEQAGVVLFSRPL